MTTNLPVFTDKDRNRAINKKASDKVIPFVYETVIAWGCKKEEDESFIDYYSRRLEKIRNDNKEKWEKEVEKTLETPSKSCPEESKRKEKERCLIKLKEESLKKLLIKETWTKVEKNHLSQKKCKGFDATLLYKLIPSICDDIGRYDPNTPSSTEIEKFLKEVKDIRNEICHNIKEASVSGTILDKLEVSAANVFKAAGVLYVSSLDKQTVQDKIDELTKMLQLMKEEMMTYDYQRILQTAKKMSVDGLTEMREAVMKQATDFLPLSDEKVTLTDVFHPVGLLINEHKDDTNDSATDNNQKEETKREIVCHELLHHFEGNNVFCEGLPGTGKTSLLKTLRQDFVAQGKENFRGVKKFDLLLYMECHNNSIKTINQLLEQHFPKTLLQLKKEDAVTALLKLNLLICVDGLDELTSRTRKLLEELIRNFGYSGNATFIFTSRPGQKQSIPLCYQTLTLQPMLEDKQVEFLRRFQANIKGFMGSDLITAFQALNDTCKACLCYPINLALFCSIFRSSPGIVKKWKNDINIMYDLQRLIKNIMITRMDSMDLENTECYAEDVMNAVADLSLCLLHEQKMTVDAKTYTRMCRSIFGQREVPYYSIISSFFTRLSDRQTFQFFHKSMVEFFAAKAILERLLDKPAKGVFGSINAIISNRRTWMQNDRDAAAPAIDVAPAPVVTDGEDMSVKQFDNVFRFLTIMMAEGGPAMREALEHFLKEVYPELAHVKIGFHYWAELTISCYDSDIVVEAAAKAAKTVSEADTSPNQRKWQITTRRDMSAVSRMLPYYQPPWLDIRPLRSEGLPEELKPLLKAVAKWHTGKLDLFLEEPFRSFSEIDDLVICLESARFALRQFRVCISQSRRAWQVLMAAVERAKRAGVPPALHIALTDPRQHQLDELEGTRHWLKILAKLNPSEDGQRCPLPRSSARPPNLSVDCRLVTEEPVSKTASLVEDLAPKDGQYYSLDLQQWQWTDAELSLLLQRLRASRVSTEGTGSPRWEPNGTTRDGRCSMCNSIHQEGWGRCVQLVVPERDPRDAVEVTRVDTDDVMRRVTTSLSNDLFPFLVVLTGRSCAPSPALGPLMEAIAKWHPGNLDVNFYHSFQDFVPVDELLARLHSARCPLVRFVGCLSGSSESAWRALVEGVKRAELAGLKQELSISLLDPRLHELGKLDGKRLRLDIRVRLPSSYGVRRPLPTSPLRPPLLIVQFPPTAGSNAYSDEETTAGLVAALIEDLAPKDMSYSFVFLQHYPGTGGALNDMVARLSASSVRTGDGTTSWRDAGKDRDGDCYACEESSHRPGERCLLLLLP